MFKCQNCKLIFSDNPGYTIPEDGYCPDCGNKLIEMCENDTGSCNHGVVGGMKICEKCGEFVCPECNAHDVQVLSRVTGYYSPVEAWAAGKQQELKDRARYEV